MVATELTTRIEVSMMFQALDSAMAQAYASMRSRGRVTRQLTSEEWLLVVPRPSRRVVKSVRPSGPSIQVSRG